MVFLVPLMSSVFFILYGGTFNGIKHLVLTTGRWICVTLLLPSGNYILNYTVPVYSTLSSFCFPHQGAA